MGVCGSCGLTLYASGIAPAAPGYIDFGSGLEFAIWPLEHWRRGGPDVEAWMRSTAFSSLNFSVSWRRAFSCRSLANCLLSMAWRHSELSSPSLPDERLWEGVAIFAGD